MKLKIEEVRPSSFNTRTEMDLESLEIDDGLIHKPVVRQTLNGYEIVAGHRRIAKLAEEGETEVDCDVLNLTDTQVRSLRRKENSQRKHLTFVEEMNQILLDIENGDSVQEIAKDMNVSVSYVYQRQQLANKLSPNILYAVQFSDPNNNAYQNKKMFTFAKARAIINIPHDEQEIVYDKIVTEGLTESQVRKLVEKVAKIREMLWEIDNNDEREALFARIEPEIYDNAMTLELVNKMILIVKGMSIQVADSIVASVELIKMAHGFNDAFPDNSEYTTTEEDGNMYFNLKWWITKEDFEKGATFES